MINEIWPQGRKDAITYTSGPTTSLRQISLNLLLNRPLLNRLLLNRLQLSAIRL
jgi:hypothetical protein